MNAQEIRGKLAKRLRRQEVPDPVWEHLIDDGYVNAVITGGPEPFGEMVTEANRMLQFSREQAAWDRRHRTTGAPRPMFPNLGEYVITRGRVRDEALALRATRNKEVRAFRERMLGGAPLSVPSARRLLASAAARIWSANEFERRGIPIVGHRAEEIANQESIQDGRFSQTVQLKVTWDDEVLETSVSRSEPPGFDADESALRVADQHGKIYRVNAWPRSVLDRLREISDWLTATYGLQTPQAARFVLTDISPRRSPLEAVYSVQSYSTHSFGFMTMAVEPWVPAEVVLHAYREAQRDFLGRENRPLSLRNLAALEMVLADAREAERLNPGGPSPTRTRSMARWNREHPDAPYKQEWQFARDVERAERAVLFPNHRLDDAGQEEDG
jgi:hypothetical protein